MHPRDCGIDDVLRDDRLAAEDFGFMLKDFEFLSTISGTQMGVAAKAPRGWSKLSEVNAAAKAGEEISIPRRAMRAAAPC
jgi:hypothetical protein